MKQCGCSENLSCGCCEGIESLTPQATANRPGLNALRYRVGTHSTFLETMLARLSNSYLENTFIDSTGNPKQNRIYPLKNLTTRATDDPSIALLDASAMMLDVLTFYQERIVSEGYLRTATERRSIIELARLVGYSLRPGVSASVYLAYTMDDNSEPVEIPIGARAQSIPAPVKSAADAPAQSAPPPAELPQSFETSEKLEARKEWNDLKPRAARPQNITALNAQFTGTIYFEGTETNLKPNDPLLFVLRGVDMPPVLRKVNTVEPLFDEKKTRVTLQRSFDVQVIVRNIQETLERYRTNSAAFCIDEKDEAFSGASQILDAAKTRIINKPDETIQILRKVLKDIEEQTHSFGNARMQKWVVSLTDELREILPVLFVSTDFEESDDGVINGGLNGQSSVTSFNHLINLTAPLSLPPSKQPANSLHLERRASEVFDAKNDTLPQILTAFNKDIGTVAYQAWANTTVTESQSVGIFALRVTAPLFGNNAPPRFDRNPNTGALTPAGEPLIVQVSGSNTSPSMRKVIKREEENAVYLDSSYDKIAPEGWVVVDMSRIITKGGIGDNTVNLLHNFRLLPQGKILITQTADVSPSIPRTDYGMSGRTTRLELQENWIEFNPDAQGSEKDKLINSPDEEFQLVRKTVVHAQSEYLELADEPIGDDVCGGRIELGSLYDGLRPGRWIIVSGERTDIPNTTGVKASELAMLAGIEQTYDENLPGDRIHSTLILAKRLAYTYKRETVKIYGNVVKATHGETRSEVLGSGDAAQAMQAFMLKQPPLTYVSAPTTSGVESTLVVRVNDIKWKEVESLAELKPPDRNFVTKTDDGARTTVVFGNGENGARLPTGIENVVAIYRNGIGKPGNVKAEQISLLLTKPLGLKEVINPLRASGGADKETRDQARRNVPIALMALDRLVSTKDYADFARTFAGIGKASAARLSDAHRQLVHLTIAGADDIPIDVNSDLYNNLRSALAKYGDSFVPVQIAMRELLALVIFANVRILPDYLWEKVEPKIRAALFDTFSFERRALGQSVFLSEVVSVIQAVEGVLYVDVDLFEGISESDIKSEEFIKDPKSFWLRQRLSKRKKAELDAARAVAAATIGKTAAAAAASARKKANTFTKEPQKTAADSVAKAAETAVVKSGATVDMVKAAALNAAALNAAAAAELDDNAVSGYVGAKLAWFDKDNNKILSAQLAYLLPEVPDTLILNKIEEVKK